MSKTSYRKIAFISSYLPRRCGIGVFCSDLVGNIAACAGDDFDPLVVAMVNNPELRYGEPVMFETRRNVRNDYLSAADFINFSHVDLVSFSTSTACSAARTATT
jgi:polysaccharide biosynthesis protein PslF